MADAPAPEPAREEPWQRVADSNALDVYSPVEGRVHLCIGGRYVSVIRHDGRLHCIDSVCFHAGGPLALGEIEELDSSPCLVCPWHYYRVSLRTGEKLYQATDATADGKLVATGTWRSVGRRQRVHNVELRPDGIYVQLDTAGALASDEHACKPECGVRVRAGALRLAAPGEQEAVRPLDASPLRRTPPASPRRSLREGEDVWPADLVDDSTTRRRSPDTGHRRSGSLPQ